MTDRAALEKLAARHLVSMQSESGVSLLHLHGGARYTCTASRSSSTREGYSAISYITLTAREPEGRSTIGFHTEWTAKKPG